MKTMCKVFVLYGVLSRGLAIEVGRGFGVVAEEIKKLSDESKGTVSKTITILLCYSGPVCINDLGH